MKTALAILLSLTLATPLLAGKSKSSSSDTVHVKGYTRKDGTVVAPYDRKAPGSIKVSTPVYNANARPAQPASTSQVPASPQLVPKATYTHSSTLPNPSAIEHVYIDSAAKLYYRANCAHEHAAVTMTKAHAISSGYRPAPDCYGNPIAK